VARRLAVLALVAAAVTLALIVRDGGSTSHTVRASFASALQIRSGQEVQIAGRQVGKIRSAKLVDGRESFWTAVYPLYMNREITKSNVRDLVHKGLEEARGNYKIVLRLFNMEASDYKRFLNFLRKHECQLPFKEYR